MRPLDVLLYFFAPTHEMSWTDRLPLCIQPLHEISEAGAGVNTTLMRWAHSDEESRSPKAVRLFFLRRSRLCRIGLVLISTWYYAGASPAYAQDDPARAVSAQPAEGAQQPSAAEATGQTPAPDKVESKTEKKGEWLLAPIPVS